MKTTKTHLSRDAVQLYGSENPGYYVMVVGGGAPTYLHPNRYAAEQEAKRLVNMLPGSTVHVMKVRSTFHNMLPADRPEPAVNSKTAESAERRAAQREKQLARLAELKQGDRVRISTSHHLHAGRMGFIHHLGDATDPTVYVCLYDESAPPIVMIDNAGTLRCALGSYQEPTRFSATSLTVDNTDPFAQRKEATSPPKSEDKDTGFAAFLGACLGGLVKAALTQSQSAQAEEAAPAPKFSEEHRDVYEAARAIEAGVEVAVINDHHPFLPITTGYRGTKVRNDEDDIMFVFVNMTDEEGTTREFKVNGSRVKRVDEFAGVVDETD
jgi:hypothetical protein